MEAGEEKTVEKTYGEDSDKAGLAGRTISLKIALKALKMRDVPELDDEFAQDVKDEYKTVADLVKGTEAEASGDAGRQAGERKIQGALRRAPEEHDDRPPRDDGRRWS
ncbi:MAG: hypothetical protein ACOX0D_04985 [Sphaerochaeta sp.]